jgi:DNA-binding SARP family transcriptional activator
MGAWGAAMAESLRIELLGGLRVSLDGRPLPGFLYAKSQALLGYLAVTGRPHSREALATLLWSELAAQDARANLRVILTNLRQILAPHLVITRQTIAFASAASSRSDVAAFLGHLHSGGAAPATAALRAAADLYRGDLLAGFTVRDAPAFEEWLMGERERLRLLALQTLHTPDLAT